MAKITQTSITLELETLSCDDMGDGIVLIDITVEEAQELFQQLKERFETYTPLQYPPGVRGFKMTPTDAFANPGGNDPLAGTTTLEYPPGVRNWTNGSATDSDVNWELEYSNLYHKVADMVWGYEQYAKDNNKDIRSEAITRRWDSIRKNMPEPKV